MLGNWNKLQCAWIVRESEVSVMLGTDACSILYDNLPVLVFRSLLKQL